MAQLEDIHRAVINQSEWVAIATSGPDGPHLVATWGDYVRDLGISDNRILIPAGRLQKTEENLRRDNRIELLFASRQVQGTRGPGQGCCVSGTACFEFIGPTMDRVKARFPWARAVLVVDAQKFQLQL